MDTARISYRGALGGVGELALPDRGIVLVVGPNGAGKSSFVEAVSVAAWGRTLRDSRPWRDGEAAAFDLVERTGLAVKRSRSKGGSQKLRFELAPGGASVEYETTAKAQAALDAQIGPFDLWRRANVFSGAEAAHLSLATDAERKRLLETMLGLEAFDQALLACKADVAAAQQEEALRRAEAAGARASAERAEESFARAQRDLDALLEERPTFAPDDELAEELSCVWGLVGAAGARARLDEMAAEIADLARACGEDAEAWQREAGVLFSRASGLAARARIEGARAARLERGSCQECAQAVPAATSAALLAEVARLGVKASAIGARAKSYDSEFAAARAEERSAKDRLYDLRDRGKEILRVLQERDDHEAKLVGSRMIVAGLANAAVDAKLARDLATEVLARSSLRVEELRAAADVLGLRGPRTTVLAGALGGVTAGANDWLRRLGGGIQIELRPYTETRSGGTTGAIEIRVFGAGGGEGYKACSSGERRRIDVALLFGLGEVASAARGGRKSTMWCDEILTHLDEDGIAGAVEAIREVARERCVVVIEQERNIAVEMLRPDRVVRLRKG